MNRTEEHRTNRSDPPSYNNNKRLAEEAAYKVF